MEEKNKVERCVGVHGQIKIDSELSDAMDVIMSRIKSSKFTMGVNLILMDNGDRYEVSIKKIVHNNDL